jgi:hypothetical protein
MLPQFILVGPKRTATTWFHRVLDAHVCFPAGVKETMFFDLHYARGLRWYESHFSHSSARDAVAESAPSYFHSEAAIERIRRHIPECRIICTLRDPVERLYSLYRLMREYGETQLSFEDAIERVPHMLQSSRYAYYLRKWYAAFGRTRVLVMLHDNLEKDPQAYVDQLCRFVGISPFVLPAQLPRVNEKPGVASHPRLSSAGQCVANFLRAHRMYGPINFGKRVGLKRLFVGGGDALPPMTEATAESLRGCLRSEILELQELTSLDLSHWLASPRRKSVITTPRETHSAIAR